ncbi:hypothetical protein F4809DRAFT_600124 [Biscogniauxia mediterranea]|nr:hypothetical protein F4809DRAFT_600124 [Biscogniauxia mediterranea]
MSTPSQPSQGQTPILPPAYGVFKGLQAFVGPQRQQQQSQQPQPQQQTSTTTPSDSGSNNHTPQPQAPFKRDEVQEEASSSRVATPYNVQQTAPTATVAGGHTKAESAGSSPSWSHPQTNPTGSTSVKRAFTAKRTNRPERPLPSALPTNKPVKDSSYKDQASRSALSPEPAKVVSDIVGISTEPSTSISTGPRPVVGQFKDQESVTKSLSNTPLRTSPEKTLKRKHEEDQLSSASISRVQQPQGHHEKPAAAPLQSSKGQNLEDRAASAVARATSVEQHIAKKARPDDSTSQSKTRTPLPGTTKPVSIKLKTSSISTLGSAGVRHVISTSPNLGPNADSRVFDTNRSDNTGDDDDDDDNDVDVDGGDDDDDDDDDDTPQIVRVQTRQPSHSNDKKKSTNTADIVNKGPSPKPESNKNQPLSISPEQSQQRDEAPSTSNSAENTDEWKYTIWKSPSGQIMMTGGALIPRHYQLHDNPDYPWVCPVRSCRTLFGTLWGLGGHFNKSHRGCDLNDNLDGTLSVVGTREGKGVLQSKVVSKTPLDPNEPPMVEPRFPLSVALKISKAAEARARNQASRKENRPKDTPASKSSQQPQETPVVSTALVKEPTLTFQPNQLALWDYIHARLKNTPKYPIPQLANIPEVLTLPRVRDIEYNPLAPFPYQEKKIYDITAMIVQATGVEPPRTCSRCRSGKGIFKGCYVVSPDAPLHARQSIKGCANCYYKLQYGLCDLRKWHNKTYAELRKPESLATESPAPADSTGRELRHERRSERIVLKESRAAASPSNVSGRRSLDAGEDVADASSTKKKEKHHHHGHDSAKRHELVLGQNNTTSHDVGTTLDPAKMLELETWEVAPGRIRNKKSPIIDNIAFSNAYLSQNQAVRISRDISFQVITIKPGTAHTFDALPTKLRLCSVASGKVKVKIAGQEFDMGPNGMFKVTPGVTATAMNMLYIDVTVHVSIMPGDL